MKKRDLYNMSEFNEYSDNEPDYIEDEENEVPAELYEDYTHTAYPEYPDEDDEEYIPIQNKRRGGGGYFKPEYYLSNPDFQKYLLKNGLISYNDESSLDSSDTSDSDSEQNIKRRKNKTKQNKTKQNK